MSTKHKVTKINKSLKFLILFTLLLSNVVRISIVIVNCNKYVNAK